ncbi:MAG: hypothetical protein K6A41_07820 [Bacteroidales bacterium]|nr:hypothetical protein [Bacteroidales bacterium]
MDSDKLHTEKPKDIIRRMTRDAKDIKNLQVEQDLEQFSFFSNFSQPVVDEFVQHFRENGGKFFPFPKDSIYQALAQFLQKQKYDSLVALTPNIHGFLEKRGIPFTNVLQSNEPADAVITFSDMLVACSGSVGFTPRTILYPSIRNLAKDIIVMSRTRCVFANHADAMAYQLSLGENAENGIVEFVTPKLILDEKGQPIYTPQDPRIFVFMVQDDL